MAELNLTYWAKTFPDGNPGIDVIHHCLNVGCVAKALTGTKSTILAQFGLPPEHIAPLAALHDIGKISQGFQCKCSIWLKQNGLDEVASAQGWQNLEHNHSKVSQFTVQNILSEAGLKRKSAFYWAVAVGAHHGRLHRPGERGLSSTPGMSNDEWEQARRQVAKILVEQLGEFPTTPITSDSPQLWWLAGLISVADWIGSDESFFPLDQNLEACESQTRAQAALESIGMAIPAIQLGLDFGQIFGFSPNDLQRQALTAITEPGIYVIEAPMGMGKTEAALACAYQLLCAGKTSGLYFALPTQITSNRIHLRVTEFLRKICLENANARLIHANAWLLEDVNQPTPGATDNRQSPDSDARAGRDWFASPKRAIISHFGVGTVDQALLAVVAAKHFFVRRFGLAGKVVIIDEVHSYDFYTGTLIRELCKTLEALGCTVILLSATLTPEKRTALLGAESNEKYSDSYPLITGKRAGGVFIPPHPIEPPEPKSVYIGFCEAESALKKAWAKASAGVCVLWICDTVAQAQNTYANLKMLENGDGPELGLLHSRFPYYRREGLEAYWIERLGKESQNRRGCVLVSTQVVEQSVDLDADLLITELAPTDMLLQRIGRLWRHPRGLRPVGQAECWILRDTASLEELRVMDEKRIQDALGAKAWVYAPYVLLRSLEVWLEHPKITLPIDIRALLKSTYSERTDEPEGWQKLMEKIEGDEFARKKTAEMAANIWSPLLDDQEGVQTRVNEAPFVSLILAKSLGGKRLILLNDDHAELSNEPYQINTARALHKNLLRVPKSTFAAFHIDERSARYVKGEQAIAFVQPDGRVKIDGLQDGVSLYWHTESGVEIRRAKQGELDHESCD